MPLDVMAGLCRGWYGDRLEPDFRPRRINELQTVLTEVGLVGPFWRLD